MSAPRGVIPLEMTIQATRAVNTKSTLRDALADRQCRDFRERMMWGEIVTSLWHIAGVYRPSMD